MRSIHSTFFSTRPNAALRGWLAGAAAMLAFLLMLAAPQAQARPLKLDRLEAKVTGRMPKGSLERYEQGLAALDRILFDKALTEFQAAAELDPQNDRLRFMIVELATYLGDTNWGTESINFYGIAIDNMKNLSASERLNLREQQRALEAVDRLTALQKAVTERDERRHDWGLQIAKEFRKKLDEGNEDKGTAAAGGAAGGAARTGGSGGTSLNISGGRGGTSLNSGAGAIQQRGGNLGVVGGYTATVTR